MAGLPRRGSLGGLSKAAADGAYVALGNAVVDVVTGYGAKVDGVTDDTTAWQNAINAVVGAGGGTVYCSRQGVSVINGAQVTATAQGYTYSGQILFPAQLFSAGKASVRLQGPIHPAQETWQVNPAEPASTSGVVLLSNATTGSVFDAIPAQQTGQSTPITDLHVEFVDITVRTVNNPQCNGINAYALASFGCDRVTIDVNAAGNAIAAQTGTGVGITTPAIANAAFVRLRDVQVCGYPVGILNSEHTVFDNVTVQKCAVAVRVKAAAGHIVTFLRLLVQQCPIVLQAPNPGGGHITGCVDFEADTSGTWTLAKVLDDANGLLFGDLKVLCTTADAKGYPILGGYNVNLSAPFYGGVGWMASYPLDTFARVIDLTGNLGTADKSNHPWTILNGSWKTNANKAQFVSGGPAIAYCRYQNRLGGQVGGSRIIRALITTGATSYDIGLLVGRAFSSGNYAFVRLQSGLVRISKNVAGTDTVLAASAAATVTTNTAYTVTVVVSQPGTPGAAQSISVYLGTSGTPVVTYTLLAQDITDLTDSSATAVLGQKADGLWGYSDDNLSSITQFAVYPLAEAA